jgi:hypothetical protein
MYKVTPVAPVDPNTRSGLGGKRRPRRQSQRKDAGASWAAVAVSALSQTGDIAVFAAR